MQKHLFLIIALLCMVAQGAWADSTFGGDKSVLYLGANNKLYSPSANRTMNAFRGYFKVDLGTSVTVRAFVLNFEDSSEATSICPADCNATLSEREIKEITEMAGAWYSIDGRKLAQKPTQKGVYIHNGKKQVIK